MHVLNIQKSKVVQPPGLHRLGFESVSSKRYQILRGGRIQPDKIKRKKGGKEAEKCPSSRKDRLTPKLSHYEYERTWIFNLPTNQLLYQKTF